jgi:hypothetical protein
MAEQATTTTTAHDTAGSVIDGPWVRGETPRAGKPPASGILERLLIQAGRGEITGVRIQVQRADGTWATYAGS